jgi:nucleoside 2-deoxyribosyltransferase
MKIYFAGSIRGGRQNKEKYLEIINCLKNYGEVLTEHIGDQKMDHLGERNISEEEIYDRDIKWLKEADVAVADVSVPSLGVGYEIARLEEMGKKILCVCKKLEDGKKLSAMITGDKNIKTEYYETSLDIENILERFFGK